MSRSRRPTGPPRLTAPFTATLDPLSAAATRPLYSPAGGPWIPPTDVAEIGDEFLIRMEVGGISTDVLSVRQDGRLLIVEGTRTRPEPEANASYHLMEIPYGTFGRVFEFPDFVNLDEISATYDNGFLTIRVRKAASAPRKTISLRINIQEQT